MAETTSILIVGGGFGGTAVARRLEQLFRGDPGVEITLVDRENFSLFTPLLPEVPSGALEPKHVVSPLRALLRRTIVRHAEVRTIDLGRRVVLASHCPRCRISVLLPGFERKVRVALDWTLDLFFPRDIVYLRALHLSQRSESSRGP